MTGDDGQTAIERKTESQYKTLRCKQKPARTFMQTADVRSEY